MSRHPDGMRSRTLVLLFAFAVTAYGAATSHLAVVNQYCVTCHNEGAKTGGLALDLIVADDPAVHSETWEKVVRRLRARQMPPAGMPRPDEATYKSAVSALEQSLDADAVANPKPGRTDTFRRLTRTEYHNSIRDLLDLDVDVATLLPSDESSRGFDNITVGGLSPTLLERYVNAAEKISRLAVGGPRNRPDGFTVRTPPDLTQESHFDGLPIGTRGGAKVDYNFPLDAEYEIAVRLTRDRDEHIEGLRGPHDIELTLDRKRVELFTIEPPTDRRDHHSADSHLNVRIPVTAGPHTLAVTFIQKPSALLVTERKPYQAAFNFYRHPRIQPAVFSITVNGPYGEASPGDTPSRRRIFVCAPGSATDEKCATNILSKLVRRAFRRPITDADLEKPMAFFRETAAKDGFDAGIEMALSSVLVNPKFFFRIESDPEGVVAGTAYRLNDIELASRLSFFLWSSIPDDELLDTAVRGELSKPDVLDSQVRRMLADERSSNLVDNFASQWLYLRNLESIVPDMRLFADFDDNLRQAFRRETELLFDSVLRENRGVGDLLKSDYTFLNERLAKHYGIPNVYGSRFRRVPVDAASRRGGLLRHGSVLTATSYATRTSPVIRGKWVLENILGIPPPPPPANVPALKDNTVSGAVTVRERLAEHRANPACSSCHDLIDPVGFSLENYDAVGRWRTADAGVEIDSQGGLPDGSKFNGVDGLEQALLERPEIFAGTVTEKLMTFALGRGVEAYDAPAVRKIVRDAAPGNYTLSSLIVGITSSTPFQMRTSR
jgi:hypothetical protein